MVNKPLLIGMVGLPRSGKSTLARTFSKRLGAPIVNRDAIRLAVHGQRYLPEAEPLIKTIDIYMIRALFGAGHDVVIVDETNYSKAAREHLKDEKWETVWYPVYTAPSVCHERAIETDQADLIPIIDSMYERYEPLQPGDGLLTEVTDSGVIVTTRCC